MGSSLPPDGLSSGSVPRGSAIYFCQTCQKMRTMVNTTSDWLDASCDRQNPTVGAKSYGEKASAKTATLEQRHRDRAKGSVHAGSSEANSTCPRGPWGPGAPRSGTLLTGDRHHAAGAGTAQSDRQRRGFGERYDSSNY